MSSSFKFLDKQSSSKPSEDAAQSFLEDKLAKNKFTLKQEDTGSRFDPSRYTDSQLDELEANGGSEESTEQQKVITNQDEIDAFNAKAKPLGGVGDLNTRYKAAFGTSAGADLQGANSAAAANKIYDKIKSLESDDYWANQDLSNLMGKAGHQETQVNIGNYSKDGGLNPNASIANGIDFSNVQSQLDEKGWNGEKNNSIGQLGSALLAAGGTGGAQEKAPEPIEEMVDIEHSPEIKEAKERVQTYENDVLSGKTSEDVYGAGSNKFQLDLNKGIDGIGTIGAFNSEKSQLATDSFLDNKKQDVKNKYQFTANR